LKEMRATGSLDVILADSLPLTLKLTADREQIAFHGRESDTITNITPFVDLFGLSPDIQCWITDYLKGSRYELKTFHGSFPWDDPLQFLDTLYAEVRVEDCEYTFAPGLEPIKTDYTDVVFQKGVLAITPHDSRFYGQDGEDSWLDINFNDPDNILLTAYILTHAVANEDILNLLEYYGISLPFVQTAGKTGADLTLAVNLNEGQLTAYGSFVIDEGEMEYEQKKYDVREARISLENATVSLERMRIAFKDMFTAGISGTVDLSDKRGDLDIAVHEFKIEVGGSSLSFDPSGTQPVLQYQIRPDGEYIGAAPSSWTLDNLHLRLGSFSMPFSFSDLSGVLPLTQLSLPGKVEAEVSGDFSIKGQQVDFQCDLLQHNVKDLVLEQERLPLSLQYDEKLTIRSQKLSQWSLNHIPVTVYPSTLSYGDNLLSILDSRIKYGHFFDSHVSGHYSYQDNQGGFLLENLQISEEGLGNLLNPGKAVSLEVDGSRESLLVRVPELDMEISTGEEKSWTVAFNDLGLLHKHSKLLRRYVLDSGTLTVSSADGEKPYSFFADIPYRYPLLVKNNKVVDHFIIDGEISEQRVQATVNEDLQIVYDERLAVTSKDIGYNIPAILKFMEEQRNLKEDDSEEKERADYSILAMQSSLYFSPDSQAPADLIRLHSADGIIRLELEHGEGSIVADIDDERFSLLGGDLNDVFMNALSPDAR
ncbi:MAG: DUF3971 domain-containing protein, partial [Candidatus Fermentibacteria bacterium]